MYSIEITTKSPITEKQRQLLLKAVNEADKDATCHIHGNTYIIRSSQNNPEKLSYLLGISIGGNTANKIVKLLLSFEQI